MNPEHKAFVKVMVLRIIVTASMVIGILTLARIMHLQQLSSGGISLSDYANMELNGTEDARENIIKLLCDKKEEKEEKKVKKVKAEAPILFYESEAYLI